jgi:hypothetical protein
MVDVLLNTDDVVVIGPPESIDLLVDIGPQGVRGSKFIVGSGEPNALTASGVLFGNTLILNDMYINTAPGENYGYMYQYISQAGANTWVQVLKVSPAIYSSVIAFTSGAGSITIPISNIVTVSGSPLTASNFNVQFQIEGANPIASSMEIPALAGAGTNLVINFDAVQYSSGTWSNLTGSKTVHLFISIV